MQLAPIRKLLYITDIYEDVTRPDVFSITAAKIQMKLKHIPDNLESEPATGSEPPRLDASPLDNQILPNP